MSKCLGLNPWVLGFVLLSPYHSGSVSDFFMAIPDILLWLLLSKCHLLFSLLTIKLSNECCISSSLELALISCIIINGLILSQSCFSQACQRKLFFSSPPSFWFSSIYLPLSSVWWAILNFWYCYSSFSPLSHGWNFLDKIFPGQSTISTSSWRACQQESQTGNSSIGKRDGKLSASMTFSQ